MNKEQQTESIERAIQRTRPAHEATGPPVAARANVDSLLGAANDAAGSARTIYLTMLAFALFLAIVTAGLADEKLLRDSAVALPLIENVDLPLSTFFLVAPWVLVLVHGDLFLHFTLLARKLHAFDEVARQLPDHEGREIRLQLSNFLFSQWHAGDPDYRLFRGFIVWVTIAVVPVMVLLYAQIGFLPYHSQGITWAQRLAVIADMTLLFVFWPSILQVSLAPWQWWTKVLLPPFFATAGRAEWRRFGPRAWLAWCRRQHVRGGVRLAFLIALGLFVSLIVATIPDETWERRLIAVHAALGGDAVASAPVSEANPNERASRYTCHLGPVDLFTFDVTDPYDPGQSALSGSGAAEVIPVALPAGMMALCPTALVFHSGLPLFRSLHRTLSLREGLYIANDVPLDDLARIGGSDVEAAESALSKVRPLDLSSRDLLYADFYRARLYRANLREARLQGANLLDAQLQGANLSEAKLQGANLRWAQLQKANLSDAQLRGANLSLAQFAGVDLSRAEMQGTDLRGAHLRGGDLNLAELQGADLRGAQLQGAALHSAELQGADLRGAHLQSADLTVAQLQAADLREAQLHGAILHSTELQGANLRGAQLQGAFLVRAQLQGADLTGADLSLTILERANFDALAEDDVAAIRSSPGWNLIPEPGRTKAARSLQDLIGRPAVGVAVPSDCLGAPVGMAGASCVDLRSPKARAFSDAYTAFLVTVACQSHAARYAVEGYIRVSNLWGDLFAISRPRFASQMLRCPAAATLPAETRTQLEAWRDGKAG